jgi:hypothetical protein
MPKVAEQWFIVENFNQLYVGLKVKAKLDGYDSDHEWYTGIVCRTRKFNDTNGEKVEVDIQRDDKRTGGGDNGAWTTVVSKHNMNLIMIHQMEWDT